MHQLERRVLLFGIVLWVTIFFTVWKGTTSPGLDSKQESDASLSEYQEGAAAGAAAAAAAGADVLQRPVWWHAPFLSGGGYGSEAVEFVLGLHRSGLLAPGSLWLTQHGDSESQAVLEGMEQRVQRELLGMLSLGNGHLAWRNRDAIIVCHSVPGAWALPEPLFMSSRCPPYPLHEAAYVIGRTMFETDGLPPDHVERCNKMHEIWVPTEFQRQLYRRSGVTWPEVVVMPEPVDVVAFDPGKHPPLPLPLGRRVFGQGEPRELSLRQHHGVEREGKDDQQPFVFLSIFKWEERKAWDLLLRAYLEEFGAAENVMLLLLTHPFHQEEAHFEDEMHAWTRKQIAAGQLSLPAITARFERERAALETEAAAQGGRRRRKEEEDWGALPAVYVQSEHLPQKQLPRLYKVANAFVLPSRGEGWGRPHVEAMSMGLPVIATNWSGPTAFLDDSVGYPLRIDGLVAAPADAAGFAGNRWAQPSVTHLRQLMRRVFENPVEAMTKGRAARARMVKRYSPEVLAHKVVARLREVDATLRSRQKRAW